VIAAFFRGVAGRLAPLLLPRLGGAFLGSIITVNGALAREISQPCSCSIRNRSACAPGRGSSAGNT
jgi:hypothetical protein